MDELRILLTAEPDGGWTTIGYLGDFNDPRYGDFQITPEMVASWQRNLAAGVVTGEPGSVALDYDHSSDAAGGKTLASGWLRAIRLAGSKIEALIEWTDAARAKIAAGEYRYFSPTFTSRYASDQGRDCGHTLLGGALTNRPFLRSKGVMAVALTQLQASALEAQVAALTTTGRVPIMSPAATPDVSGAYDAWAAQSPYGGDAFGANHCRVDSGRAELDAAVRRQLAQNGGDDYGLALDQVLAMAASGDGTVKLSSTALAGTGIDAPAPGWRDHADVQRPDPERDPRFLDASAFCASRKDPAAEAGTGVGRRGEAFDRRHAAIKQLAAATGETYDAVVLRLGNQA